MKPLRSHLKQLCSTVVCVNSYVFWVNFCAILLDNAYDKAGQGYFATALAPAAHKTYKEAECCFLWTYSF